MALCGVEEEGPQTVDQFAVYSLGPGGTPPEKPDCIVKIEGPDGPLEVKVESLEDGNCKVDYNPEILSNSSDWSINMIVDGIPTKDSPTKVHLGNIADTERCSAIEPNLEELVVYARDKNGKY
eukprot:TRINITY_DN153_c0_g1_i1.p2 TRINITY_DN153_c0_g1~~TRINITY_DN153_c0_g1_i1.p2  ORF type:complete len:123 (-),score=34.52 TRINITY_DN153_c0_g1_i1:8-376(-)